ncbi:uncharacterized protein [Rutidosis leptorrhynchoides]|uniref:uncharacterized protein n=1 Tax=Rutidosis leptorrhynchoides TaxID=125765 RepID=UPI003A993901
MVSEGDLPVDMFRMKVGDGTKIRFWHDLWCGNSTLVSRFNRLYLLDSNKDSTIADKCRDGVWHWTWSRDNIGSRNEMLFNSLTEEIGTCILHDRPDAWSCTLSSDGNYTVKSTRDYLDKRMLPSSNVTSVWFKFLPRKVNVFLWRLKLDSLPAR